MNLFALSTVVQANAVDVENILRKFEGRRRKYPTIDHTSRFGIVKTFELVPSKDNEPDAEFDVDTMSAVERAEREKERATEKCDENNEMRSKLDANESLATPAKEETGESEFDRNAENDVGSVTSQHSQVSLTKPLVNNGGKMDSMYTEHKLDPKEDGTCPSRTRSLLSSSGTCVRSATSWIRISKS